MKITLATHERIKEIALEMHTSHHWNHVVSNKEHPCPSTPQLAFCRKDSPKAIEDVYCARL